MGEVVMTSPIIANISEQEIRELWRWFAGLIATDGTVYSGKDQKTVYFRVYSIEDDWLQRMSTQMNKIGVMNKVRPNEMGIYRRRRLILYNPQQIVRNLINYDCEQFCSPRKWGKIKEAYEYYENLPPSRRTYSCPEHWSPEEVEILKKNWKLLDKEIAIELPSRTLREIAHKRNRLGLKKHNFKQKITAYQKDDGSWIDL